MSTAISVEHISKQYRLGQIGGGTLAGDINRWWARLQNKEDPYLKIGDAERIQNEGETIWALRDVTFQVEKGRSLGIIGRNGAGKSTLLKILSRVTAPTSGLIKVNGRIASLLEVGTGFHPDLTGRENISLNGALMGMSNSEIKKNFDAIVDFAGVGDFIDTPVKRYSSGMYVRLAFAVAAYLDPDILIVDEVLAVGDAAFQKKCLGKMGDVVQDGRTVLFVSHNMNAILSLCKSCLWVDQGKIVDSGTSQQVVGSYLQQMSSGKGSRGSLAAAPRFKKNLQGLDVVEYELLGEHSETITEVNTGGLATLRLVCQVSRPLSGVVAAINFFDASGHLLNRTNNRTVGQADFNLPVGRNHLDIRLQEVPLLPGVYRLSVAFQDSSAGYYDWLDQAIELEVVDRRENSIRLIPDVDNGSVYIPISFEMSNTREVTNRLANGDEKVIR